MAIKHQTWVILLENFLLNLNNLTRFIAGIDVSQNDDQLLIETSPKNTFAPIVPPRNQITNPMEGLKPSIGTKLEGLNLLNSDSDSDFDPRADENEMMTNGNSKASNDMFGFEPTKNLSGHNMFNSGSFTDGTTKAFTHHPSSPPPLCKSIKKIPHLINFNLIVFSGTSTKTNFTKTTWKWRSRFIWIRSFCTNHTKTSECEYFIKIFKKKIS